jgi:large subunit ribosomal protein L7/L12
MLLRRSVSSKKLGCYFSYGRTIFNLGLKDAKDLVDKTPCTLSKAVKVDDAKSIKEKLEAIGCEINLL